MADGIIKKIQLGGKVYDIAVNSTPEATHAGTADKLSTARQIAVTGAISGSTMFDGSANVTITTTATHTHNQADITQETGDYLILDCGSSTLVV